MRVVRFLLLLMFALVASSCVPNMPPHDGGSIEVRGREVYWESEDFPIWVLIDERMPALYLQATLEAADDWNTAVGEQVFEPIVYDHTRPAPRRSGFIAVSMRDLGLSPRNTRMLGLARAVLHTGTTHMKVGQVWFDLDLSDEIVLVVMQHELGHALTLEHDNDCDSVMHPQVTQCEPPVHMTLEDRARIRYQMSGRRHVLIPPEDMAFLPEVWRYSSCVR